MTLRSGLAALGIGITTALVAAIVVIEALAFEFSAIIGLPVGLLVGVVTAVLAALRYESVGPLLRSVGDGVAGLGYAVVLLLALRYIGFFGLRSTITFHRLLAVAFTVGLVTVVSSWLSAHDSSKP